jgi:MFS family permease
MHRGLEHLSTGRQSGAVTDSQWNPLRRPLFRAFWAASVVSSIGTWMHETGAIWLMTSLTSSPVMVALMQTATTLPVFMLSLPAGALADLVDRRKLLLCTQASMLVAAATLGILTLDHAINAVNLLVLTFALGAAAATNSPAWQATMTQFVPREEVPAAVAWAGVGLNLARALGPALGGVVIGAAGFPAVFFLNAVSFVFLITVLFRRCRSAARRSWPPEPMLRAISTGIRYARSDPALRAVFVRTALVVPFASALWALLPLLARREMALDAFGYGILFGCLGAGAVGGGVLLAWARSRFSLNALVAGATFQLAAASLAMAVVRHFGFLCVILIAAGMAWMALMASFNLATQTTVPHWVKSRALALYLLIVQGGMAGGSVLWGMIAQHAGIAVALQSAAAGLLAGLWAATRHPLRPLRVDSFLLAATVASSRNEPVTADLRRRIDRSAGGISLRPLRATRPPTERPD